MECDLTINSIDVVIAENQDANPSNSEESSTTSSTVNTPIENANRTFAKSLLLNKFNNENRTNELIKKEDEKLDEKDVQIKSDVKSIVSNSSQSTLTDDCTNLKDNKESHNPPWNSSKKERFTSNQPVDKNIKPGEFVLRTLFSEFALLAEKKIDAVLSQDAEKPLSKLLQRGEDPIFDQLLSGKCLLTLSNDILNILFNNFILFLLKLNSIRIGR